LIHARHHHCRGTGNLGSRDGPATAPAAPAAASVHDARAAARTPAARAAAAQVIGHSDAGAIRRSAHRPGTRATASYQRTCGTDQQAKQQQATHIQLLRNQAAVDDPPICSGSSTGGLRKL
jgi:hypothetical protein